MHKWLLNECRLHLKLRVPDRLQIAAPRPDKDDKKNSKESNNETEVVRENGKLYLPGSSVKGVLRQRAEYIANLVNEQDLGACHLFDPDLEAPTEAPDAYRRMTCGHRFNIRQKAADAGLYPLPMATRYRDACPACQLFGHTFHRGQLRVTDFKVSEGEAVAKLTHIALDRITNSDARRSGKSRGGKGQLFSSEYVTDGLFVGELVVQNFTLWQLGWLGFLVRDLEEGLIRLGHKQTSGAGRVMVEDKQMTLRQIAQPAPEQVAGVGVHLSPAQQQAYGCGLEDAITVSGLVWERQGVWHTTALSAPLTDSLLVEAYGVASTYLSEFQYGAEMAIPHLNSLIQSLTEATTHA